MNERARFGRLGTILVTAGSAVGLGNIWRFPYMTGHDGGAAFLIVYFFCILLLGIPGMVAEFVVGRHGASNAARAFAGITPSGFWRWLGYQMIFFLAGLQNIDASMYEAAKIDGANKWQSFWRITLPMLKPMSLFTTVMAINSALQVYDESVNLTNGGPGFSSMSLAHYVYNTSFVNVPNFGYSCAMGMLILLMAAIITIVQMKVGDKRE